MEYDAKKRKSNDDDSKLIKTYSGEDGDEPGEKDRDRDRAGIERMQRVLQLQAFACAEYFKRLQERNQEKSETLPGTGRGVTCTRRERGR
jgi:hypothetical protein